MTSASSAGIIGIESSARPCKYAQNSTPVTMFPPPSIAVLQELFG